MFGGDEQLSETENEEIGVIARFSLQDNQIQHKKRLISRLIASRKKKLNCCLKVHELRKHPLLRQHNFQPRFRILQGKTRRNKARKFNQIKQDGGQNGEGFHLIFDCFKAGFFVLRIRFY